MIFWFSFNTPNFCPVNEEFLIILPNTSEDNAFLFAERFRKDIERMEFIPAGEEEAHKVYFEEQEKDELDSSDEEMLVRTGNVPEEWYNTYNHIGYDINSNILKPENWDLMIKLAANLSKDFPFVRVDLYNINGRIIFGELTFYPGSGYTSYTPDSFDFELGQQFVL